MSTPTYPITKGVAKVPVILQLDMLECGAACLDMILAYYGKWIPLEQVRSDCGINRNGSNAKNIVLAAKSYGLEYKAYKTNAENLKKEGNFPCMIHWSFNHFVVLDGFKNNKAIINDPARGKIKISWEEFEKEFTGVVLFFKPSETFETSGEKKNAFTYLKSVLSGYKKESIVIIIATIVTCVLSLAYLTFNKVFLDKILDFSTTSWLNGFLIAYTAFILLNTVAYCFLTYFSNKAENKIETVATTEYFWKVLHLPIHFFEQRLSDEIAGRISSNKNIANIVVNVINPIIAGVIMMVFYLIILSQKGILLSSIGIVALILNVIIDIYAKKVREDYVRIRIRDTSNLHSATMSGAHMVDQIKASGAEENFIKKWRVYQDKVVEDESQELKKFRVLVILPESIKVAVNLFVLLLGVAIILSGKSSTMTLGVIYLMQGILTLFFEPISQILRFGKDFQTMSNQVNKIEDVLEYPEDSSFNNPEKKRSHLKLSGQINIDNITFGYSKLEKPVIRNFSAYIQPGMKVAICGASGSGKSTVASLLANLYEPWSGKILFDGRRHNDIDRDVFKDSFAITEQEIYLFEGTIEQNIMIGDPFITREDMIAAAHDACIHDEIMHMNGGYQHKISGNGMDLSGGQRQRIEIARVLARNPKIIVLDEATSALDALTEHEIISSICKRGITCIVVAHRLSTIRNCDEIIVLDKGEIAERGTHENLMSAHGKYCELVTND